MAPHSPTIFRFTTLIRVVVCHNRPCIVVYMNFHGGIIFVVQCLVFQSFQRFKNKIELIHIKYKVTTGCPYSQTSHLVIINQKLCNTCCKALIIHIESNASHLYHVLWNSYVLPFVRTPCIFWNFVTKEKYYLVTIL